VIGGIIDNSPHAPICNWSVGKYLIISVMQARIANLQNGAQTINGGTRKHYPHLIILITKIILKS
jgi:hypothetical protein